MIAVTVRDLVDDAHARFRRARLAFGHGTVNAWDEAVYLVLHALRLPLDQLTPVLARKITAAQRERALRLVDERIRRRIPAAYLTHEAWLGDFRFYVDERVIVPRSFIAELLREGLRPWLPRPARIRHALDLGTGSGCLAILVALAFPRARVDASDISQPALTVARRNVNDYGLQQRVRLIRSNLFGALGGERYDLIISNPPYVSTRTMRSLPREHRREPRLALAGGADGLAAVRVILREAAGHLTKCGLLVIETGHHRRRVERAFPQLPFIWPETSGGDDCVFILERRHLEAVEVQPKRVTLRATPAPSASRPR